MSPQPQPQSNPEPVPPVPPVEPPYVDSVYNVIVRRLRSAKTIFGDRIKLVLRQYDDAHWAKLGRPYLLVVPRQVRAPRDVDMDYMSFINPREVTFVAHFDARGSEMEYQAANAIDTAERQLIFVLANWSPFRNYKPTMYGGMRIQGTREPDVKCNYIFLFNEVQVIRDESTGLDDVQFDDLAMTRFDIHVNDSTCHTCVCEEEPQADMEVCVSGGDCPKRPEPDPCAPQCPPVLGGDDDAST